MRGRFDDALDSLDQVDQECLRTLKVYQYWATYVGLLKLKSAIYKYVHLKYIIYMDPDLSRGDIAAAELLLQQLSSTPYVEPDCALEISISRLDLQTRKGNYSAALAGVTQLAEDLIRDRADLYHRIRLMVFKADLLSVLSIP